MFNVTTMKKVTISISIIVILIGLISSFVVGFNWDIDFTGGTAMQIAIGHSFELDDVNKIVTDVTGTSPSSIQYAGDGTEVIIKTNSLESEKRSELFDTIADKMNIEDKDNALLTSENFTATVGKELQRTAITATLIAILLMLLYITFRFELLSGFVAIITLAHDVLIIITLYVLLQIPVNISFIAVVLTILGYSINNTIVIFDRIRENVRLNNKKLSFEEIINVSVRQTLRRSIYTTLTTLLTITILYFIGVQSIKEFALPLIIGMLAGTYSSIFLAGPIWSIFRAVRKRKTA